MSKKASNPPPPIPPKLREVREGGNKMSKFQIVLSIIGGHL